jgi:uncharacterized protein (TIGR04255 family)
MAKKATNQVAAATPELPGRKKYRRNFLKQVIARIDFVPIEDMEPKGPPKSFYKAIKARFPIPEIKTIHAKTLRISTGAEKSEETSLELREWIYHGNARDKYLAVGRAGLAVEYSTYSSFEVLREDFLAAVVALFEAYGGLQVVRLGLRYINNIELNEENPTSWDKYIRPDLLAIFKIAPDQKTISRAFQILEMTDAEVSLRFQYGMPNPDYPAQIRKKVFVMDTDASCTLILGRDEITRYLNQFHDRINLMFESVITNDLRKKMGVRGA